MQYEQQQMRYGPDPSTNANKRVAYMSPMRICEDEHTFRIGKDHDSLKGLDPKEQEDEIKKREKKQIASYGLYLAMTMLEFQDRELIFAPYNFR
jgi:hypothetical protein